jgi:hypothetical protein
MEALIIAGFVIAVLALALSLFLIVGVSYVLWKYVYTPWTIMRADVSALAQWRRTVDERLNQAQVMALDDAEVARREARLQARARGRMPNSL